ncbi:MAG TPA: type I methionyl aminopeptidase [Candidatus Mcinerneyibacteriales bacterium]|nr:type I methionyl aminopeptidase [Candidatus Mcinerneyibacteriales bacterium]HPJ70549.1 type I methionyl aminopeptidase [Candidatus Mcinerneyibacteriales bacterium]
MKVSLSKMKRANAIIADLLCDIAPMVKPGVSTAELDRWAEEYIRAKGGRPAFKGLYGFPATLCVSINEEIVHGIPRDNRIIAEGDVVSVDVGAVVEGHYADAARTFAAGDIQEDLHRLITVTRDSFFVALEYARPGYHIGDMGHAVQRFVEDAGFNVIRDFVGHGIGRKPHTAPEIPNFGEPGEGDLIKEGMYLAIEPMVVTGSWEIHILDDHWTVVTRDGGISAHYENTIFVSKEGPMILSAGRCEGDYGQKQ